MTYFWICVSAWGALNGTVIYALLHDMWVDRRNAKTAGGAQ